VIGCSPEKITIPEKHSRFNIANPEIDDGAGGSATILETLVEHRK
jgi:hypothetical protein